MKNCSVLLKEPLCAFGSLETFDHGSRSKVLNRIRLIVDVKMSVWVFMIFVLTSTSHFLRFLKCFHLVASLK